MMNFIIVAYFFKTTCGGIFKHLIATNSKEKEPIGPVFTYFGTIETKIQGVLQLHCLV